MIKTLLVVDWNELEMDYCVPIINNSKFGETIKIWNCKKKKIFSNPFFQRYYEYISAVAFILQHHKKYTHIVLWQQIIGFMLALLPTKKIHHKTIITTVLYSEKSTKHNIIKNYIFRNSIKKVKALLYYSKEMYNEALVNFKQYNKKFYYTNIPILFSSEVKLSKSQYSTLIDPNQTIFCGGSSDRDFETVILAFRNTKIPVVIVCPDKHLISNINLLTNNIKVLRYSEVSNSEYYYLAHKAFCILIPLKKESSSCGQLLFSFAMNNNKPIIASDSQGVRGYIKHKFNGLLVSVKNSVEIRKAYTSLIDNKKLKEMLCKNSKDIAKKMSLNNYLHVINKITKD